MIMTSEVLEKLKFYRDLVTPYLEFYSTASRELHMLIAPRDDVNFIGVEDIHFRQKIYMEAEKLEGRFLFPGKSCFL